MADKGNKNLYPAFLDLGGRKCLVVGGGAVAERKINTLVEAGADVAVVAPEARDEIKAFAESGTIKLELREYRSGEAADYALVVAATGAREVNEQAGRDAMQAGRLVNVVDAPELCNFIVPSVLKRGDLRVAFSTSGACPALAKKMRRDLEAMFPESYGDMLVALREFRLRLISELDTEAERKRRLEAVVNSEEMKKYLGGDESPLLELLKK